MDKTDATVAIVFLILFCFFLTFSLNKGCENDKYQLRLRAVQECIKEHPLKECKDLYNINVQKSGKQK